VAQDRPTNNIAAIYMWNATVEHQLRPHMTVKWTYGGNKGTPGSPFRAPTYNLNREASLFGSIAPDQRLRLLADSLIHATCPGSEQPGPIRNVDLLARGTWELRWYGSKHQLQCFADQSRKTISQGLQFVSQYTCLAARFYDNNYFSIDPQGRLWPHDVNRITSG